jgi:aspartyl protease family protein
MPVPQHKPQTPWDDEPPPPSRGRIILWIALLAAGALALAGLFWLFPSQQLGDWGWARLTWAVVLLAAISTAVLTARRFQLRETARNIALWLGVVVVLAVGYTYQDDLGDVWRRVKGEFVPSSAVETGANSITLTQHEDGHFYVLADVNGAQVRFLIDTGASGVVLSPTDARRVGIDMAALEYDRGFETANGTGMGANVRLASLAVGPIRVTGMPAYVNQADMSSSLLGMAFLRRLDGFEFRGRKLILHWH